MMKTIVLMALFGIALSSPLNLNSILSRTKRSPFDTRIVRSEIKSPDVNGHYETNYELSNGIIRQETGQLKAGGSDGQFLVMSGTYSFPAPTGETVTVSWEADELGYRVTHFTVA